MEKKKNKVVEYLIKLSLREKIILFCSIAIVLFIIFQFTVFNAIDNAKENTLENIENLNLNKQQLIEYNKENTNLVSKLYIVNSKYNKLLKEFPIKEEQPELVAALLNIGSNTKVSILNLSFSGDKATQDVGGDVEAHTATVEISGDYKNILEFINKVENSKRKITIQSVTINKDNNDKQYQSSINISYFNIKSKEKTND